MLKALINITETMEIAHACCGEDSDCNECPCQIGTDGCIYDYVSEYTEEQKAIMDLQEYVGNGEYNGTNPPIYLATANISIKALEKQIPKKPDLEGDGYDPDGNLVYDTWICPNCEKHYEVDYDNYDYCPKCGQKIVWNNDLGE